jgi:magnesium transporter
MFVSVSLSGVAGTLIPMMSKRLGFDPALTAGPFETALQDVAGVDHLPRPRHRAAPAARVR